MAAGHKTHLHHVRNNGGAHNGLGLRLLSDGRNVACSTQMSASHANRKLLLAQELARAHYVLVVGP